MPIPPWHTIDLIEKNLVTLATLGRGHKLARPDSTGLFRVSTSDRGREAADSITSLEPLIRKFLKRAILVAACSEHPPTRKVQGLVQAVATVGFANLLTTYSRDSFFNSKTDQRDAVRRLLQYLRESPRESWTWVETKALSAFLEVRKRYASGSKSSNKRYQVLPGGKYAAPNVPAVNSDKKLTIEARNNMALKASRYLSRDRDKVTAEEIAKSNRSHEINGEIRRLEGEIRSYNLRNIAVDKVYDDLTVDQKKAVKLALAQAGVGAATAYQDNRNRLKIMKSALDIRRQGAQYVAHDRWQAKAGNCDELATLVCLALEKEHVPFVSKASLSRAPGQLVDGKQGDHVFAIVGLRLVNQHSFTNRDDTHVVVTPSQRHSIGDAHVIDPWANIHCAVADYPARFRAKMAEWSTQGKQIGVAGNWIDPDPTTTDWYARTIQELDWVIGRYRGYDEQVFNTEELVAAQQQRRRDLARLR